MTEDDAGRTMLEEKLSWRVGRVGTQHEKSRKTSGDWGR